MGGFCCTDLEHCGDFVFDNVVCCWYNQPKMFVVAISKDFKQDGTLSSSFADTNCVTLEQRTRKTTMVHFVKCVLDTAGMWR
jgi:hypothetical protein